MSIKAGQILHAMNQFVVDRIQTGGPGNLNIPQERIYELGNFQSVGIVRDVPDLSFSLDCLDVSTEVEALLMGSDDPGADLLGTNGTTGTVYDYLYNEPVDVISPLKSAQGAFNIVKGIAVPQLTLESASYRYGLKQNAGEQFSLKGDSIFYTPGTPYQTVQVAGVAQVAYPFQDDAGPTPLTAQKYVEQGVNIYALNVSVDGVRKVLGTDYTATNATVTFTTAPATGARVSIVFSSATAATYAQSVHEGIAVQPAAIRGKDIKVYVGAGSGGALTTGTPFLWGDVQSVNVDWRVRLEEDFEFGNPRAVARDFAEVPEVSGTIEIKPMSPADFMTKLQQITGVASTDVIGPQSSVALPLKVQLLNPDSGGTTAVAAGTVLKTLFIPDARFEIPGYEGRQSQKMVTSIRFTSDGGTLKVFKGKDFGVY